MIKIQSQQENAEKVSILLLIISLKETETKTLQKCSEEKKLQRLRVWRMYSA